ncbi:MAG: bifunctional ornithine acetyltransferase/N-acetylglutamate synthase, partial [Actinobacteria bacterium]|nr:bifunctional ornithine acetyltransferase/N-acetylglutamate synthase [Actinomycetota bacterium]
SYPSGARSQRRVESGIGKKKDGKKNEVNGNMEGNIVIGGIAKGSGMIAPNMATMLAFISTNVSISSELLDKLLLEGVERTFNCITIDGCQSTNDMVLVQANGESRISISEDDGELFNSFKEALFFVLEDLAKKIVMDGEGATKFIEIEVVNALTREEAKKVGMKIANSMLFKTAMFGEDLNWGRINAAIGSADVQFDPSGLDIYLGGVLIVKNGIEHNFNRKLASNLMRKREIFFKVDLKEGKENCRVWTTDLSHDYIKINSFYHT